MTKYTLFTEKNLVKIAYPQHVKMERERLRRQSTTYFYMQLRQISQNQTITFRNRVSVNI